MIKGLFVFGIISSPVFYTRFLTYKELTKIAESNLLEFEWEREKIQKVRPLLKDYDQKLRNEIIVWQRIKKGGLYPYFLGPSSYYSAEKKINEFKLEIYLDSFGAVDVDKILKMNH